MTGKPNSPHNTTDEFEIRARQQTLQGSELERYCYLLELCDEAKHEYVLRAEYAKHTELKDKRQVTSFRETNSSQNRRQRAERIRARFA